MPDVGERVDTADEAWNQSLREVMKEVIVSLPDQATLGELVSAARSNTSLAPMLEVMTVKELIDMTKRRPRAMPNGKSAPRSGLDEDGNALMDLSDAARAVIRRRADAPDGDTRVLRSLSKAGPQRDLELANACRLTADQLRIILRQLRAKGFIHVEGSGAKRRIKVTRQGTVHLRKIGAND